MEDNQTTTEIQSFVTRLSANLEKVIVGKHQTLELVIIGLLCQGHLLIEDVPGVGKTMQNHWDVPSAVFNSRRICFRQTLPASPFSIRLPANLNSGRVL